MKKYQVIWGFPPPQYDKPDGRFRLFFASEKMENEYQYKNFETGEITNNIVTEWKCDVIEYDSEESKDILRMLKENPNSIEFHKWMLKSKIEAYDKSSHVNDFTINGIHLWLDSTMRSKVKENLETCQQLGESDTILRFGGMSFPVSVQLGWQMYYAVLAYARDSWNVTENHLSIVDKIETVDELKSYDYTVGYPEKLVF